MTTELAPKELRLVEDGDAETWLGDMKLVGRRPLTAEEIKKLKAARITLFILMLVAVNVVVGLGWAMISGSEAFVALTLGTAFVAGYSIWRIQRLYSQALIEPEALLFSDPSNPAATKATSSNARLVLAEGSKPLALPSPASKQARTLAAHDPDRDLSLTADEIRELQTYKKGRGVSAFLLSVVVINLVLSAVGSSLFMPTLFKILLVVFALQLIDMIGTTLRVDRCIKSGTLSPDGRGRYLLANGAAWIEDDKPAAWRRIGADLPKPEKR